MGRVPFIPVLWIAGLLAILTGGLMSPAWAQNAFTELLRRPPAGTEVSHPANQIYGLERFWIPNTQTLNISPNVLNAHNLNPRLGLDPNSLPRGGIQLNIPIEYLVSYSSPTVGLRQPQPSASPLPMQAPSVSFQASPRAVPSKPGRVPTGKAAKKPAAAINKAKQPPATYAPITLPMQQGR